MSLIKYCGTEEQVGALVGVNTNTAPGGPVNVASQHACTSQHTNNDIAAVHLQALLYDSVQKISQDAFLDGLRLCMMLEREEPA